MYIIDKNKDFYDYLGSTYGIDKTITYDRRGSTIISDQTLLDLIRAERDEKKEYLLLLEIGDVQFVFSVHDVVIKKVKNEFGYKVDKVSSWAISLTATFNDNKHYFEKEITLVPASRRDYYWYWVGKRLEKNKVPPLRSFEEIVVGRYDKEAAITNPILRNTSLVRYLDATEVWKNLSNFISSKYNDKTVEIVNSDVDKLVNHGFDKVTSFRNPIK